MNKKILRNSNVVSLGNILKQKELNQTQRFNMNLPPEDGCCNCCDRHVKELKQHVNADDSLPGDFGRKLFVKRYRRSTPYDEKAEKAYKRAKRQIKKEGKSGDDPLVMMIRIFGKEDGEKFYWSYQSFNKIDINWECRDCGILNEDEYFERKNLVNKKSNSK